MDIDTADMEEKAASRVKKIVKLGRELKGKDWEMIQFYKNKMTKFKDTMPLIQDLKNPAMRDRHWSQLMEEVGKTFDPHCDDFSLGTLIGLELDEFADPVAEISGAATKELQIENNINDIVTVWDETLIDVKQYKDGSKGHSLIQGNTDDLYTLLEDHQVPLLVTSPWDCPCRDISPSPGLTRCPRLLRSRCR
jgi:dynein heavy chain